MSKLLNRIELLGVYLVTSILATPANAVPIQTNDEVSVTLSNTGGVTLGPVTGFVGNIGFGTDFILEDIAPVDFNDGPDGDIFSLFFFNSGPGIISLSGMTTITLGSLDFIGGAKLVDFEILGSQFENTFVSALSGNSVSITLDEGSHTSFRVFAGRFITGQIPEPTSLALIGLGLAGIGCARRRKKCA